MKICQISAECSPLAQVGGLGEVVGALTAGLAAAGHDVRLFLPRYRALDVDSFAITSRQEGQELAIGDRRFRYSLWTTPLAGSAAAVTLIDCDQLYDRNGIYAADADEPYRYALLSIAALRACRDDETPTEIVHAHDWHAALAPWLVRSDRFRRAGLAASRSVLTVHNLAYQGVFDATLVEELGLSKEGSVEGLIDRSELADGRFGFLRTGIRSSDLLTTVSPTYAREIQTPEHGIGLDGLLRSRADRLIGILNGVDPSWNPASDERIPVPFTPEDLSGKAIAKRELLRRAALEPAVDGPLLVMVSRLVEQKGCELFRDGFVELLEELDAQFVLLGTGDEEYEELFRSLQRRSANRVGFFNEFNVDLAHLVEAGGDVFLMPSRFEPCGLNQMYSMLYGTVPVVHATGGLADTVPAFSETQPEGTGFPFDSYTTEAFHECVRSAVATWQRPGLWRQAMHNGMTQDFSWARRIARYVETYRSLDRLAEA